MDVGKAETIQKRAPESWLKLVVQLSSHYPNGGRRLCHNCDTKPVFVAKTGFIDKLRMLILQNLLKVKDCRANPAYEARPLLFHNSPTILANCSAPLEIVVSQFFAIRRSRLSTDTAGLAAASPKRIRRRVNVKTHCLLVDTRSHC
jgi:hypothetical protein